MPGVLVAVLMDNSLYKAMQSRAPQKPRPRVLVCALVCGFVAVGPGLAGAQPQAWPPLQLKPSVRLQETLPPAAKSALPTYLSGERTSGRANLESVLEGHAELRRGDTVIRADRLEYYQPDDQARASGAVRINRAGNVYEGPLLELKLDAGEGFFLQPSYQLLGGGHGQAERIDFIDERRSVVTRGTYTTCRREGGPSWMPDWILRAASIKIDTEEDVGVATDATLSFKGVPILPVPYLTFPLSGERKSGFLPPTVGADSTNGAELTVPYYWNIAPNRDAKFTPSLLTKRGVDLGAEFRFLEAGYSGEVRGSVLPEDRLRGLDRWNLGGKYAGLHSIGPVRNLALSMNVARVSDDNYWKDFARESTGLTQRLLANDVNLSWNHGSLALSARALKWQTLQDTASPITPPYDRMPQLVARYAQQQGGWAYSLEVDHTQFQSDPFYTGQPNSKRSFALGQVSHTWRTPGFYITPKLQWHGAQYEFDSALTNGARNFSRAVPTFSVDAGMVFERETRFLGRDVLQTLEPRVFYVKTPFVDQSLV
ncbi:MAG: hypothetical protein RLZZ126_281, partial [Pseudomonadota bacterium]